MGAESLLEATVWLAVDYVTSGGAGQIAGAIGAASVDHDDFVQAVDGLGVAQGGGEFVRFVKRGDYDRDGRGRAHWSSALRFW